MPDEMFQEIPQTQASGMRVRTAPNRDTSKIDPLGKLATKLRDERLGLRVHSVITLADGPFVNFDHLVQAIHVDPPAKNVIERLTTTNFGSLKVLPLIWPDEGLITVGLCGQNSQGQNYSGETLSLPFEDNLLPHLAGALKVDRSQLRVLVLENQAFGELRELVKSSSKRESHLGVLDLEKSAEQLFPQIVKSAILKQASDIHIGPVNKGELPVYFRIDGVMHQVHTLDVKLQNALVVVIKNFTEVQSIDKRKPFDARIGYNQTNTSDPSLWGVDMRVSILPEIRGFKTVIRLSHGTSGEEFDIDKLSFPPDLRRRVDEVLLNMNGIVLVTGPTGSGKTTTLYSMLNKINTGEFDILTIEDPVEAMLPGVTQVQVNSAVGLSFAEAVKRFMRQDPDVILVGEIRDRETAEAAVQAALTGHLVFATLHTNDSFGTIARLRDLGIANSLLNETVRAVFTQRLVRSLCPDCKEEYDAQEQLNYLLGREVFREPLYLHSPPPDDDNSNSGCGTCNGMGFIGRIPAAEIWVPGSDEKSLIMEGRGDNESFYNAAKKADQPITTMFERALKLVKEGQTSVMECIGSTASLDYFRKHAELVREILLSE